MQLLDQLDNFPGGLSGHGLMVLKIPFHDQLGVPVHMDMPGRVVANPGKEHVTTPPDLAHRITLPPAVTVVKSCLGGLSPHNVSALSRGGEPRQLLARRCPPSASVVC